MGCTDWRDVRPGTSSGVVQEVEQMDVLRDIQPFEPPSSDSVAAELHGTLLSLPIESLRLFRDSYKARLAYVAD